MKLYIETNYGETNTMINIKNTKKHILSTLSGALIALGIAAFLPVSINAATPVKTEDYFYSYLNQEIPAYFEGQKELIDYKWGNPAYTFYDLNKNGDKELIIKNDETSYEVFHVEKDKLIKTSVKPKFLGTDIYQSFILDDGGFLFYASGDQDNYEFTYYIDKEYECALTDVYKILIERVDNSYIRHYYQLVDGVYKEISFDEKEDFTDSISDCTFYLYCRNESLNRKEKEIPFVLGSTFDPAYINTQIGRYADDEEELLVNQAKRAKWSDFISELNIRELGNKTMHFTTLKYKNQNYEIYLVDDLCRVLIKMPDDKVFCINEVYSDGIYFTKPEAFIGDYDEDGEAEVIITCLSKHGTGFYVEDLFIVDKDNSDGSWKGYALADNLTGSFLADHVKAVKSKDKIDLYLDNEKVDTLDPLEENYRVAFSNQRVIFGCTEDSIGVRMSPYICMALQEEENEDKSFFFELSYLGDGNWEVIEANYD